MLLPINLSESVKVKLTAFGEAILAQYELDEYRRKGGVLSCFERQTSHEEALRVSFTVHRRDPDGYYSFQLIDFCEIFGPAMSVFAITRAIDDFTILLDVPDGRWRFQYVH